MQAASIWFRLLSAQLTFLLPMTEMLVSDPLLPTVRPEWIDSWKLPDLMKLFALTIELLAHPSIRVLSVRVAMLTILLIASLAVVSPVGLSRIRSRRNRLF